MSRVHLLTALSLCSLALLACSDDEPAQAAASGGSSQASGGASAGQGGVAAGQGGVAAGQGGGGAAGKAAGGGVGAGGVGNAGAAGAGGADAGAGGGGGSAGAMQAAPVIGEAKFAQSDLVPLAGMLSVTVDRASKLEIAVDDGKGHSFTLVTSAAATSHAVPIVQLRPARTYKLSITARDDAGTASQTVVVDRVTQPLPADFPPVHIDANDPAGKGLTVFAVSRWTEVGTDDLWGYIIALDPAGEVVWYVQALSPVHDIKQTKAGTLRYGAGETGIVEITPQGELKNALYAINLATEPLPSGVKPVAVDTLHHDIIELPNGHLVALSTEMKTITPATCSTYDKDYPVVADVVIEIDPATGEVVDRVSMFDLLDPCRRVDQAFKSAFWVPFYGEGSADWTHANSVFYDEPRNRVLVSLRHQDWVIAYRHAADAEGPAGQLLFRFGVEGDLAPASEATLLPYHQHAAKILSDGHLMLFDNGNDRPGTFSTKLDKLSFSRGVEYELATTGDKSTWKATQVWEHGKDEVRLVDSSTGTAVNVPYFDPVVGETELTAEGTVLITHGSLMSPANGFVLDPKVKKSSRIVEVTHETPAKIVMDVRIEDEGPNAPPGYLVYRAKRFASLYADGGGVEIKAK